MASLEMRYRQALQALEAGNNQRALSLLNEVLNEDSFYVDAWVAKARALPNGEEKLDVLEQILLLDPDNEYANEERAAMLDLPSPSEEKRNNAPVPQQKMQASLRSDELIPGIPRRWALMAGVGLAVYTLLICGVTFLVISTSNTNRAAAEAEAATSVAALTQSAQEISGNQTATAQALVQGSTATAQFATAQVNQTATAQASITPSISPSPTITPIGAEDRVAPAPPDIPGTILAWGGFNPNPASEGFAELRLYDASSGSFETLNEDEVQGVSADVAGERIVYVLFDARFREQLIVDVGVAAVEDPRFDLTRLVLDQQIATEPGAPSVSADGERLAFTALVANGTREIFYFIYATQTLIQVTSDNLNYLDVALSADGNQVAAVRQSPGGVDLVLFDVTNVTDPGSYPVTVLTNDGNAVVESSPAISPIGASVAYSALPEGANEADILTIDPSTGVSTPLVSSEADEAEPVFSPTGRYLAYAANPRDVYNIFILDTLTNTTYQLTVETNAPVYPGGWSE